MFSFQLEIQQALTEDGLKLRASTCSHTSSSAELRVTTRVWEVAAVHKWLESWGLGFELRSSGLIHFNMDPE